MARGNVLLPDKLLHYSMRAYSLADLRRRCRRHRAVVLTYDDGPGPRLTPLLLAMLGSYDARATFFLLGRRIAQGEEVVDRVHAAGHELGVHSYDHGHAWRLSSGDAVHDIQAGYDATVKWVPDEGLYRPPHGKLRLATWRALRSRGARICWWTEDSGDTWPTLPPVTRMAERIRKAGGGVVLMHDFDRSEGRESEDFVLDQTERLLKLARRESFQVLTMGQLFG